MYWSSQKVWKSVSAKKFGMLKIKTLMVNQIYKLESNNYKIIDYNCEIISHIYDSVSHN